MRTYIFDACAAVDIYCPRSEKVKRVLKFIVEQRTLHNKAALYIPDFCIVEVFNTLAKMHFKKRVLSKEQYEDCLQRFRNDIHWASVLYPYAINRYHMLGADEIIPIEQNTPSEKDWDHLSTYDILLIAMASELAYLGDPEEVFLVTCDRRVKRVCDSFKETPATMRERWKVRREIGEAGSSRWIPPTALYLPWANPAELNPVSGQHRLNK
jgi:predicted nucleic acid-binding protein